MTSVESLGGLARNRDGWPMLSEATVPLVKPRFLGLAMIATVLLWSASPPEARCQEPPPLEAPAFEPPLTETAPPAGRSAPAAPASTVTNLAPGPAQVVAPKPIAKPPSAKPAAPATTRDQKTGTIPAPKAPAPARATIPAPTPESRPVLAIPGLTMPSTRSPIASYPPSAAPSPTSVPLAAPIDSGPARYTTPYSSSPVTDRAPSFGRGSMNSAPAARSLASGNSGTVNSGVRDSIPLGIEPIADDPPANQPATNRPNASPATSGSRPPIRSTPGPLTNDYTGGSALIRRNLGRVRSYLTQTPENSGPPRPDGLIGPKFAAKLAEPEPDAVVKKRVEKQLRETLGDRVKSLEVRVSGRNVLVAAKPAWFWQRRGVKRSIESLPALEGYRVRVDLDD